MARTRPDSQQQFPTNDLLTGPWIPEHARPRVRAEFDMNRHPLIKAQAEALQLTEAQRRRQTKASEQDLAPSRMKSRIDTPQPELKPRAPARRRFDAETEMTTRLAREASNTSYPKEKAMTDQFQQSNGKGPLSVHRDGAITAKTWRNQDAEGQNYYTVKIARTYRVESTGEYRETNSFSPSQLLRLKEIVSRAYEDIARDRQGSRTTSLEAEHQRVMDQHKSEPAHHDTPKRSRNRSR